MGAECADEKPEMADSAGGHEPLTTSTPSSSLPAGPNTGSHVQYIGSVTTVGHKGCSVPALVDLPWEQAGAVRRRSCRSTRFPACTVRRVHCERSSDRAALKL